MLLRILTLFIAVIHFNSTFGQEGILRGKITDSTTKEPLGGVSIYIDKMGASTSKTDGAYEIKIPAGVHLVEFRFIGYMTTTKSINVLAGKEMYLTISLLVEATELGTMVVSAGKFEQKLEEVTVSMEVIRSELIHNKNTTSADNIMDQCPGVNILDGQANIRGGSGFSYGAGTRVLVLVDDLPILTADAGDVKWNFIPVENIEQVEIIKGASSALFGSSAMNGVINFRTSYPKDTARTDISVSSGMYDDPERTALKWWGKTNPTYQMASFLHSEQMNNFDLVIGGNNFIDEGYRKLEKEQRGRLNFNTRYRFQKVKGLAAGINGNLMDTRGGYFILWHNADSAYYPSGGSVSEYYTKRTAFDPFVIYSSPKGNRHSLRTRYYRAVNTNNTNQESVSDVWYGEYQYQMHLKKNMNITGGITTAYSEVHSDSLYGNHYSSNAGFFSQADKKFGRLIISAGVRGEYFNVDTAETKYHVILGKDTSVLPVHPVFRAGMNYRLLEHTHVRASFGQGYRFPSVAEKFIKTKASGLTVYPNPEIQPETGWSAELGAKQAFRSGKLRGYLDLAVFRQEYRNMMEFTFDYWVPPGTPNPTSSTTMIQYFGARSINVGRARITGSEIAVAAEASVRKTTFTVLGGYTYIRPVDLDYDSSVSGGTINSNILKYRYEHTAKLDLQADRNKWSAGTSVRYNSFMKNIDASFQKELFNDIFPTFHSELYILPGLEEYREEHNTGDFVLDCRFSYKLTDAVKFSVVVNNLLNREYMGRPGDVQPPRSFAFVLIAKI